MDETKKNTVRFYVGKKVHDAKLISEKIVSISMGKVNYNLEKIPVSNEVDTNPLKIKLKDFQNVFFKINLVSNFKPTYFHQKRFFNLVIN